MARFWILFFLWANTALSAEMNLSQAVETAFQNSPNIQKARSFLRENSWKKVDSFSTYLPSITGSFNYLPYRRYAFTDINFNNSPVTVPQIIPTTAYNLQAEYNLFDGLNGTNKYLAARAFERSSEKDLEWTEFQVDRQVTLEFYKSLASRLLKEVADQNLKTLEDHLKDANLFKKAGMTTNFDVLRVEVQVSEARSEVLNAEDNSELAKGHLAEVLGQNEPVETKGTLPVLDPNLAEHLENSFAKRADILSLQEKVHAYDDMTSAESRFWVPRINLVGLYQYYNNRNREITDNEAFRYAYQIGINLSWNLFDGFSSYSKFRQSDEQKVQAEKSLRMADLKAKQDIEFWKRKFIYFCTIYKSRLSDIEKSKESVRLAREGRRLGARTNTDLLDAEAELYRAQAGAVNAQIGSIEALINLELATGQKIYQFE